MNPISSDPEVMGGTPCFVGTRVPIKSLFDHLQHGYNVDYFVAQFPTVTREQVDAVLEFSLQKITPAPAQNQNPRRAAG